MTTKESNPRRKKIPSLPNGLPDLKLKPSAVLENMLERLVTKLFVLDTNVFMHDPTCVYQFDEHDIFIPMMSLEELDFHKKGQTEISRNVRQTTRTLDEILDDHTSIIEGVPLEGPSKGIATGRLFLQTEAIPNDLPDALPVGKADNQILSVVLYLQKKYPDRPVILVSKDINMRIKARVLGLEAQDYLNDKVLEDTDLLPTGVVALPQDFWSSAAKGLKSWKKGATTYYTLRGKFAESLQPNQFLSHDSDGLQPLYARVIDCDPVKGVTIATTVDYTHQKNAVWGITARNPEQNFALNALMDPDIDFVTLLGQAGTGKTLLTLAAALEQTLEQNRYTEIIFTRVTVPVGEDIGFLPGNELEKMTPWMGALEDNLDVLSSITTKHDGATADDFQREATHDLVRSRLKIKSLNFMRGRTFLKKFVIIDEAQNLTSKQMKTLITRAGPGTKVVCLGNIGQIDTPYLTEGSSGLTYVVTRFAGWPHSSHVILTHGERSRLADHASEVL